MKQKNKQDVLISRYKKLKESTLLSNTECDKHNVYMLLAISRTRFRKPSLQIKENKGREASCFHPTIWYKKTSQ